MKAKYLIGVALSAALLGSTALSVAAAEKADSGKPGMSMQGGSGASVGGGMGGMMGGGMGGMMGGGKGSHGNESMGGMMRMMNMMGKGNRMMEGGMADAMPQLPPGNEKLQLQMQAEIMQKMGETLAKYAARIK